MDKESDPVTNLGPDSGGRRRRAHTSTTGSGGPTTPAGPGSRGSGSSCSCSAACCCSSSCTRRRESAGSLVVLAVGLAFLIKWAIDRGTASLYAGAIITALAAPGVLNAAGVDLDGLGTFCFGVAFLFIALVRFATGGGWGWQLWFGGLLAILGGVNMTSAAAGGLIVPVALIVLGVVLLTRGPSRRTF